MHVHAHMQGEGEGATERGGDRDGKGETERCEKLLVGLPLTFRHEPTRAWLVVDIDSAPALPSLALLQAFDGEIPKRHVLGPEPAVLRKEDRQAGRGLSRSGRNVTMHFVLLTFCISTLCVE